MSRILLTLATLLTAAACAAGTPGASPSNAQAFTLDADAAYDPAANDPCAELATTGDMYRHCRQVGPQQALLHGP